MNEGKRQRLAEIRHRVNQATSGPWHTEGRHNAQGIPLAGARNVIYIGPELSVQDDVPDGRRIALFYQTRARPHCDHVDDEDARNAEFIAGAREDVPWLMQELAVVGQVAADLYQALLALQSAGRGLSYEANAALAAYRGLIDD